MADDRIALVTGGNKGIGLGICRGLARAGARVILTARDAGRGEAARAALEKEGLDALFHPLDVTDAESVARAAAFVKREFGRLDILVNNAAIRIDRGYAAADIPLGVLREMMEANAYGALRTCQAFAPLLKRSRAGRIVNLSSGMASLAGMGGGSAAYRISKVCLNALTRILAEELRGAGVLVNCCHPGWVRTDMGGAGAAKSVEEGADTPVWLALLPEGGPTGGFFRDRGPMPW